MGITVGGSTAVPHFCAGEWTTCNLPSDADYNLVFYGAGNSWNLHLLPEKFDIAPCNNGWMRCDPFPGVKKACFYIPMKFGRRRLIAADLAETFDSLSMEEQQELIADGVSYYLDPEESTMETGTDSDDVSGYTQLEQMLLAKDPQKEIENQLVKEDDRLFCDYAGCGCGPWLCPVWCWSQGC